MIYLHTSREHKRNMKNASECMERNILTSWNDIGDIFQAFCPHSVLEVVATNPSFRRLRLVLPDMDSFCPGTHLVCLTANYTFNLRSTL